MNIYDIYQQLDQPKILVSISNELNRFQMVLIEMAKKGRIEDLSDFSILAFKYLD
jgi:hypothetical protein